MATIHIQSYELLIEDEESNPKVTKRFGAVAKYTQSRVKTSSKLTNSKIKSQIKEYSGE